MSRSEYESLQIKNVMKSIPLTNDRWNVEYSGGGIVHFSKGENGSILISPSIPKENSETFAALITLDPKILNSSEFIFEIEVATLRQLREVRPNAWEVFWVFFNYNLGEDLKKQANYFIPKVDAGIEVGKAFGEVGQEFLVTQDQPLMALGEREKYTIVKRNNFLKVFKREKLILFFKDQPGKKLYDHPGTIGIYTEDATIKVYKASYSLIN